MNETNVYAEEYVNGRWGHLNHDTRRRLAKAVKAGMSLERRLAQARNAEPIGTSSNRAIEEGLASLEARLSASREAEETAEGHVPNRVGEDRWECSRCGAELSPYSEHDPCPGEARSEPPQEGEKAEGVVRFNWQYERHEWPEPSETLSVWTDFGTDDVARLRSLIRAARTHSDATPVIHWLAPVPTPAELDEARLPEPRTPESPASETPPCRTCGEEIERRSAAGLVWWIHTGSRVPECWPDDPESEKAKPDDRVTQARQESPASEPEDPLTHYIMATDRMRARAEAAEGRVARLAVALEASRAEVDEWKSCCDELLKVTGEFQERRAELARELAEARSQEPRKGTES